MTTFFTRRVDQERRNCCDNCDGDPCECEQEPCFDNGSCPRPDNQVIDCDTGQPLPNSIDIACCNAPKPNTMRVDEFWSTNFNSSQYTAQALFNAFSNWSIGTESNLPNSAHYFRKYVWTWSQYVHPATLSGGQVHEFKPCKSSYCVDYQYKETESRFDYSLFNCFERWFPKRLVRQTWSQHATSPVLLATDTWEHGDSGMIYAYIYQHSGGKLHDESWTQRPQDIFAIDCECGDAYAVIPGASSGGIKYNTSFFGSGGLSAKVVSIT